MGLTSPCSITGPVLTLTVPNPENSTLDSERFIALHIILVRIIPLAPTSEPATINRILPIAKPAAAAARPEKLFNKEITTGISAPPIGSTNITPNTSDKPTAK